MRQKPVICLTFDLEEFDLPVEYNQSITAEKQFAVTRAGMEKLLPLLAAYNVSATFFTTANFAEHNPDIIRNLCTRHELASHSFFHSSFKKDDLVKSKLKLEEISGQTVVGFRMPRMLQVNYADLLSAGYLYDSSLHPTLIPGRYNHFSKPIVIHKKNNLLVFPATVTPVFRTPLFWLSFKNLSAKKYAALVKKCLDKFGYANIYLHPWEFTDLSTFKLPRYIARDGHQMISKLTEFLATFANEARFISIKTLLKERNEL